MTPTQIIKSALASRRMLPYSDHEIDASLGDWVDDDDETVVTFLFSIDEDYGEYGARLVGATTQKHIREAPEYLTRTEVITLIGEKYVFGLEDQAVEEVTT